MENLEEMSLNDLRALVESEEDQAKAHAEVKHEREQLLARLQKAREVIKGNAEVVVEATTTATAEASTQEGIPTLPARRIDVKELIRLWTSDPRRTQADVARHLGCSQGYANQVVNRWLKENGLKNMGRRWLSNADITKTTYLDKPLFPDR